GDAAAATDINNLSLHDALPICAEMEGYEIVSSINEEKITLYGKKMGGMYRELKVDFKGGIYTRPFWNSVTTPAFLPKIFYLDIRSEEHTSELQSRENLVCRLLL